MTPSDWIAVAVPTVTIGLAIFSTYAGPLGTYLAEKTHNDRLIAVGNCAGRVAAEIANVLQSLPAGTSLADVKAKLMADGVAQIRAKLPQYTAAMGATDPQLLGLLSGELAKIPANVTSAVMSGDPSKVLALVATTPVPQDAAKAPPAVGQIQVHTVADASAPQPAAA